MTKRKDFILKMLKNTNGCKLKLILKGYVLKFLLNLIGNRKDSEVRDFIVSNCLYNNDKAKFE
jgi:hypothetical protein